jgi:aspartate kinase
MLVTVGERVSMALLSMAIQDLGEKAISFTGSQSGIITNDTAGAARIIGVRPYRVQDELSRGNIVIVAGYQGVSYKLEVTTLGRGGSDTTAVALAAALGAEACEIYSDVDGIYTSDPRVVVNAERISHITYEEMQELARLGAKVLNAEAVEFARRADIALYAKKTGGDGSGTTICRPDGFPDHLLEEERSSDVTGVAGRKDVIELVYRPEADASHFQELLFGLGGRDIIRAEVEHGHPRRCRALLAGENVHDLGSLKERLDKAVGPGLTLTEGLGLVSAVGSRVGNHIDAFLRMHDALAHANIEVRSQFCHRLAVSALVDAAAVNQAMQVVHAEFLEPG